MTWGSVILGLLIMIFLAVGVACFLGFLDLLDQWDEDK